jgi:Zn-dependent peptidase ImmA (M78 family)/DNA-binding XRE family transcriptional regulator
VFNFERMDLARRRRGFTKAELADAIGLSPRVLTAYERGEYAPTPSTIDKLSHVLRYPPEFFFGLTLDEPPIDASSFRALSNLTAKQRDQAIGAGAFSLALSDWIDKHFRLLEPKVPQLEGVDPETAAAAVRSEWGLGERPIRNMIHVLEAHGVRVFSLTEENLSVDAYSFWRGDLPYVFLNTMKSAERSRMDAAHELGHLVLHWKGGVRGRDSEHEAQQFGSAFLMPRDSVLAEAPRGGRLDQIIRAKSRWGVAAASLTYRMHKLGLLSDWQYRAVFLAISREGYRTNEPNGAQRETSQVLGKVFKALREEGRTMAEVAYELTIPLDDLRDMLFGLTLTPVDGVSDPVERPTKKQEQPELWLV